MGRAIGTHEPRAVDGEAHGKPLDRHVMDKLVIGALQEGRINGAERLVALGRKARREGHGMLFGDADIEGAGGEFLTEKVQSSPGRHGGGDGDDSVVLARFLDQTVGKDLWVGGRIRLGRGLRAGHHVKCVDAVIFVVGGFGGRIALAFLGHDMNEDRPTDIGVADILQHGHELVEIMPVDRPDIVKAEFLEQGAAGDITACMLDGAGDGAIDAFRQLSCQLLADVAQLEIGARRTEPRQIDRHGTHRGRNRHVIVVEDDDQTGVHGAGIVHGLKGHARRHGTVADDRNDIVVAAVEIARHSHAEASRDRGRRMGGTERVVFAFGSLGETGQAAALAERADAVATPSQDFVRIGLVADVPDQTVAWRVKNMMNGDREFDHAKPGTQMPAGDGHGVNGLAAQFGSDLAKVRLRQPAKILRAGNLV